MGDPFNSFVTVLSITTVSVVTPFSLVITFSIAPVFITILWRRKAASFITHSTLAIILPAFILPACIGPIIVCKTRAGETQNHGKYHC